MSYQPPPGQWLSLVIHYATRLSLGPKRTEASSDFLPLSPGTTTRPLLPGREVFAWAHVVSEPFDTPANLF